MTKTVLLLSFVLFVSSVFADCDTCSAYKTQVVNDCNSLIGVFQNIDSDLSGIQSSATQINNLYSNDNTIDYLCSSIYSYCSSIESRVSSSRSLVRSISDTASSLVCTNSAPPCDCATALADILSELHTIASDVHSSWVSDINREGLLYNVYGILNNFVTVALSIEDGVDSISNNVSRCVTLLTTADTILSQTYLKIDDIATKFDKVYNAFNNNFWQFRSDHLSPNQTFWSTSQYHFLRYNGSADQAKSVMNTAIVADDFLKFLAQSLPLTLSSLNNYHYANWTNNAVVNHYLDNLQDYVSGTPELLTNIVDTLHFIASSNRSDNSSFYGFFTNTTSASTPKSFFMDSPILLLFNTGDELERSYYFDNDGSLYYSTGNKNSVQKMSFKDMVVNFSKGHFRLLTSLNNYSYFILKSFDSVVDTVQSVSNAISSIERKFSIFTSSFYESDTPLKYYDGNGSYHDYLTNYYIRLSEGQQSGTETFTNWFNRIEILLAALVFQDSPAGTNEFSDSVVSTSTIDQSKQQADNSINQVLQSSSSYTEIVNTSGQSIINMVSTWDSCLKNVSKPAPFAICEFGLHDSASEKEYFMFPMDNEIISSLVDIGHGISTICWITAFLFLGYAFSRWVISKLAMMISFAYDIYTAIFGGK